MGKHSTNYDSTGLNTLCSADPIDVGAEPYGSDDLEDSVIKGIWSYGVPVAGKHHGWRITNPNLIDLSESDDRDSSDSDYGSQVTCTPRWSGSYLIKVCGYQTSTGWCSITYEEV